MPAIRPVPRRSFLQFGAACLCLPAPLTAAPTAMRRRPIPGSDEELPVIGLGTSDEFGRVPAGGAAQLTAVLTTLAQHGGSLIDTAPGYGDAERILGKLLSAAGLTGRMFLSTKVRSRGTRAGIDSMERSLALLGKQPLDLVMVHSLVDAATQLDNLARWKEEGRVRYIGITTSRASGFEEMEALIRRHALDFIQVNYSPLETGAAERVIPAAREHGVAIMINRPFANGRYFGLVRERTLPDWAAEFDCESWAQLSLKYILGHPDVTCALAATSNPEHMRDNARAGFGSLPDGAARRRIAAYLQGL